MAEKKRELTEQQKMFLDHLGSEEYKGNFRGAMDAAGYAKTTSINYMLSTLHEEITELAQRIIAGNSIKAAFGIIGVLDNPNQSNAKNTLEAGKQILDRAGVQKRSDDVNLKIPSGGIVILPAKQKDIPSNGTED